MSKNALSHLLQNALLLRLIYTIVCTLLTQCAQLYHPSLDSLHPNEQVYMHLTLKESKCRVRSAKRQNGQ